LYKVGENLHLTPLQIAGVVCIILITALFAIEVRSWIKQSQSIVKRQKVYRATSTAIIIAVASMVLVGDEFVKARFGSLAALIYWLFAFGLALMLVVLVLADVREISKRFSEESKRMYRDLGKNDENSRRP
jgi:dolichol kinase